MKHLASLRGQQVAAAGIAQELSVDDVAGQVVYLCKTSTITGQSIVVDGGIHFH